MPGHFTHIYTQRRVADWLAQQSVFNPDDANADTGPAMQLPGGFLGLDPKRAAEVMAAWPGFAAVGAIGPDLFFFCQDYSAPEIPDDELMLALRVAYWVDEARDQDWKPLVALLAEVNTTFAQILSFLLQLQQIWDDFIQVWNQTIGPFVSAADAALDDLTGGVISEAGAAISALASGLEQLVIQELATFKDIFEWFSLKMRVGYDEQAFLWSDMLHYRKTNQMARALLEEAERQFNLNGNETQLAQFQAFALGWICHIGSDVIDHSFVNEQCGGPFRTHWQRHHLIENHIDAWNYRQGGTVAGQRGTVPSDGIAADDTYTDVGVSALGFTVALDPDHSLQHNTDSAQQYGWTQTPDGWSRPASLPDDPTDAKNAIDVDGELPDWLAEGIVRALIATYNDGGPAPKNLAGGAFQATSAKVLSRLENALNLAGINVNQPLDQLVRQLAPAPDFEVPPGFPLPWEVQVSHRFMITYYKFAFWSSFNLDKPRRPSVIIWPPASDFSDLASAPDLSGVSGSDPAEDFCDAVLAIIKWLAKEGAAVGKLVGDTIKALASPGTYPLRWALYQLAMSAWDMASTAHDILAHTGFMLPHGALTYSDNGEQRWTNEIDNGLISLGSSLDGSFAQALADATDPFGNLDTDPSLLVPLHNPRDPSYPYLPVRDVQLPSGQVIEFHRPWDYPTQSGPETGLYPNAGETSDIRAEVDYVDLGGDLGGILQSGVKAQAGTASGPFPQGATPDQVFFRTGRAVSPQERAQYEQAPSPAHTDAINMRLIGTDAGTDHSPLGDAVPFIGYLMGQVLSPTYEYEADFNLDADRGYGYRCWDWIRGTEAGQDQRGGTYLLPQVPPEGAEAGLLTPAPPAQQWQGAPPAVTEQPIQLHYLPSEPGTGTVIQ